MKKSYKPLMLLLVGCIFLSSCSPKGPAFSEKAEKVPAKRSGEVESVSEQADGNKQDSKDISSDQEVPAKENEIANSVEKKADYEKSSDEGKKESNPNKDGNRMATKPNTEASSNSPSEKKGDDSREEAKADAAETEEISTLYAEGEGDYDF